VSTDPQTPAVEISGLVKRYGQTTAVDGLTLSAAPGAVTGILGPNGAGKTTTIEICDATGGPTMARCASSVWTRYAMPGRCGRGWA
jgi:ABC-type branched-subunit amino acid transport system ATPase component